MILVDGTDTWYSVSLSPIAGFVLAQFEAIGGAKENILGGVVLPSISIFAIYVVISLTVLFCRLMKVYTIETQHDS